MKRLGLLIGCILYGGFCMAGNGLAVQDSLFVGKLPVDRLEKGYVYNPATFGWLRLPHLGELAFHYQADGAKKSYSPVDGDGGRVFRAQAFGYGVEHGKGMYSGMAAWESGIRRHTAWTDVRDEYMLGPYRVADSLGGDYYHESYRLGGSAAFYGGRGIYGLRANYRGTMAFRKADPRPENTISELTLNPGALWVGKKWDMGVFVNYVFYKQHVSIRVEESSRKDMFYILKGFGLYDHSFSTIGTSFKRYYRSHEYGGGIQGKRKAAHSLSFRADYHRRGMEVEESDLRLPFLLKENRVGGELGGSYPLGKERTLIWKVEGKMLWQTGLERNYEKKVADTQTGSYNWQLLSESDKYKRKQMDWKASALLQQIPSSRLAYWYGVVISGENDLERYLYPAYQQRLSGVKGSLMAGMLRWFGKNSLEIGFVGGYRKNITAELDAPPVGEMVKDFVVPEYDFRRRDYFDACFETRYSLPLKGRLSLAVEVDGRYEHSGSNASRWGLDAGLALMF